jgi:phenylacetate-coenzyme A ligase PaaK-like adenylate-forming protein
MGKSKKISLTVEDLRHQTRIMGMWLAGLEGASRVLVMFYLRGPTWTAGPMGQRAVEDGGLFGLMCDHDLPPEKQVRLILGNRIDTLLTSMSAIQRLTREAGCDPKSLGVKWILLATQAWPDSSRAEIEQAWGATVLDIYGLMEFGSAVAAECPAKRGLHIAATDFWVEVVDLETGAPLPDGEYGEVVLSTLTRRGLPIVRYRTHDLACLMPENGRCACGTPTRRLSRVRGRLDQVLILGLGVNVLPDEFDAAILAVPGVSDYQLAVDRDGFTDVLHLTAESDEPIETLAAKLEQALTGMPIVKQNLGKRRMIRLGEFRVVPRGTLSAGRPKSIRLIDRRKTADDYSRSH